MIEKVTFFLGPFRCFFHVMPVQQYLQVYYTKVFYKSGNNWEKTEKKKIDFKYWEPRDKNSKQSYFKDTKNF